MQPRVFRHHLFTGGGNSSGQRSAADRAAGRPPSSASPLSGSGAVAASAAGADSCAQLLADFPAVVNSSKQLHKKPSGDVEHHIVTRGPPMACRFRRLDGEKLAAAKKEFLQMEKDGIVRRSNSPWSSPLHMVTWFFHLVMNVKAYLTLAPFTVVSAYL